MLNMHDSVQDHPTGELYARAINRASGSLCQLALTRVV
jgi:hypothetical protein